MEIEDFAKAILTAEEIADEKDRENIEKGELVQHYGNRRDAAEQAAQRVLGNIRFSAPIYLLITYGWNDIQDWANEELK